MEENHAIQQYSYSSYNPVNPLAVLAVIIIGPMALITLIAIVIASWRTLTKMSATLVNGIISFVVIVAALLLLVIIAACVVKGIKLIHQVQLSHLAVEHEKEELEARKAERRRLDERHHAEIHLLKTRAGYDENGNPPIFIDAEGRGYTLMPFGQFKQPVPGSLHVSYRSENQQELVDGKAPQLGPGGVTPPTVEEVIAQVKTNSFELCLGRSLTRAGEFVMAELPDTHIKIIGASRMGKSCEAGIILHQAIHTHDTNHLVLALLDHEYKTSRLFEHDPHVLRFMMGQRTLTAVARDPEEVAKLLLYLVRIMEYRCRLPEPELLQLPHILIYLEEFLDLKRKLKDNPGLRAKAFDAFTTLAVRGLKANMHLMVCAQVDYADDDLKDAMNQFVGINISFSVRPEAARAAGFMNYELLSKNYAAKTPGQFVVEMTGGADLAVAAMFDVKAKVKALQEDKLRAAQGATQVQERAPAPGIVEVPASAHPARTLAAPSSAHQDALNWEAYLGRIAELKSQNYNQEQIIEKIWGIKKGGNPKWNQCRDIYQQCIAALEARRFNQQQ